MNYDIRDAIKPFLFVSLVSGRSDFLKHDIRHLNPYILHLTHIGEGNMDPGRITYGERITRWHELDIIPWGQGIDHVMGKDLPVTGGDVFYRTPGLRNCHDLPYYCYFFIFDPYYTDGKEKEYQEGLPDDAGTVKSGAFWEPIPLFSFASTPYLGKARNLERLLLMCKNLMIEYSRPRRDEMLVKILFMQLLKEVSDQFSFQKDNILPIDKYQQYWQPVRDIQAWIQEHPAEKNSMQEMADRLQVSYSFFSRIFRSITGDSYANYVTSVRISNVKTQLLDTRKTVTEIAHDCGFTDPNYLYIAFRRLVGCIPTQYRIMTAYRPVRKRDG